MINRKFLGLVVAAVALAATAVPAGAATAGPVSLQMPGGSTWGNLSARANGSAGVGLAKPQVPRPAQLQDVDTEI